MLGLALEGAALVARRDVEEGMRCLDEATAAALDGEATIPISSAWTCCFLVSACTAVLDFERASEWCDRIAEFAERYGSRYMLAFCRAEYGAVHLWRGRWAEAEAMLDASIEDFAPLAPCLGGRRRSSGWPSCGGGRAGRPRRAALLERAGASAARSSAARASRSTPATPRTAAELAERLLRQRSRAAAEAPALELLVRASIARGRARRAATALEELREVEQLVGTPPLRASADLAEGMLAAARDDHERARTLLEDAVDGYERSGAPFETAQARLELAATLVALGRTRPTPRAEAAAAAAAALRRAAARRRRRRDGR